jgi:hypothetical protein
MNLNKEQKQIVGEYKNTFENDIASCKTLKEYNAANREEMWEYRRMGVEDTNNLREIRNANGHHFNYKILKEMRNGTFPEDDDLFNVLPAVREILQINEAYQSYSQFMKALSTDDKFLQSSSNAIRKTYNRFMAETPQRWYLIDPEEYLYALQRHSKVQSGLSDDYWKKKIFEWENGVKENIQQFAGNSYLISGPTLDPRDYNENDENLLNLLWYNLTGDETIPYKRDDLKRPHSDREFIKKYWNPFWQYIGTKFGDSDGNDIESYETDAPMEGLFNLVAEFDKNRMDADKNIVTLNKLIDVVHGRGSLSHLFVKGGVSALNKIAGYKKINN